MSTFDDRGSPYRVTTMMADTAEVAEQKLFIIDGGITIVQPGRLRPRSR